MTHVATFVCHPDHPALDAGHLEAAARILPCAQMARWLADGVAADIPFKPQHQTDASPLIEALRDRLAKEPIDIIVQPEPGRRKKLLVADMDSTMIGQECLDELADFIGRKADVAEVTARAMRGEIDFVRALRERVALLAGLRIEVVEQILAERISITPGGEVLVKTMRAHGAFTALVSGGFAQFATPIAERLGFDMSIANRLTVIDGRLTGTLAEPILDATAKRRALLRLRRARRLAAADTLAVGDGANDLAVLMAAGLGVGFRPKPIVAAKLPARLDHADLTALLYVQGYPRDAFWR